MRTPNLLDATAKKPDIWALLDKKPRIKPFQNGFFPCVSGYVKIYIYLLNARLFVLFFGKSFIVGRYVKTYNTMKTFTRECQKTNLNLNKKLTTKYVALIAIFSALYSILRLIPMGPMIGLSQSFSVSDALAPLLGIILGPFAGGISVIIGTFTAAALGKPLVFLGLDFLPAFVNCVAMGFLIKRKWIPVAALYAILLGIFIVSPYSLLTVQVGSLAIPFMWLHIVALVVLISPLSFKAMSNIKKFNIAYLALSVAVLAFIGTMLQHLTGNLIYQLTFGQPIGGYTFNNFAGYWNLIFFVYPIERTVIVLITVLLGVPLIRVLKKSVLPFETPLNEQPKEKESQKPPFSL